MPNVLDGEVVHPKCNVYGLQGLFAESRHLTLDVSLFLAV